MHPMVLHDLAKARTSATCTARPDATRWAEPPAAPGKRRRKQGTPFMPAQRTAELIRRVLTLLGARRPERYPVPAKAVRPGRPG